MTKNKILIWIIRAVLIILIFANTYIILTFSSEDGEKSSNRSDNVAGIVAEIVVDDYNDLNEPDKAEVRNKIELPIRKLAHMAEYASLSFLLCALLYSFKTKIYVYTVIPVVVSFALALYDELGSQSKVEGRVGTIKDVICFDTPGALIGMVVMTAIILITSLIITKRAGKVGQK